VTAGLALRAEDWPWSSASKNTGGETAGAPGMQELQTRLQPRYYRSERNAIYPQWTSNAENAGDNVAGVSGLLLSQFRK
jgi:hypothetical protein